MVTFDVVARAGVEQDRLVSILNEIVHRYEGLRTTFEAGVEAARQVVHPVRENGYRCVVTDEKLTAENTGWLAEPFDLTHEWPIRAAIGRHADGRWMVRLAVHRMILDHEGMLVIRGSFNRSFETGSIDFYDAAVMGTSWEPVDIAEFEHSDIGKRRDERAYQYWRRVLAVTPASLFPTSRPEQATDLRFHIRWWRADLRDVVARLAEDFRVTEPAIAMTAGLLACSWIGDWPVVSATIVSNNRSHPEMRRSVSPMLDRSLLGVTVDPERTFGSLASTVGAATIGAYKHSHGDPNTLLRAYGDVSMERGILLDRLPILNIMSDRTRPLRVRGQVLTLRNPVPPDSYDVEEEAKPLDGIYMRLRIYPRCMSLELLFGEQIFDRATGEALLALVPATIDLLGERGDLPIAELAELVGVERPTRDLVRLNHTRVDLAAMHALLRGCAGVTDCAVSEVDGRLVASVVGDEQIRDLAWLRRSVLTVLPKYRHVLCPHEFRVVASLDDPSSVLVEGSGWPGRTALPPTAEEQALAEAVAAAHPPLRVDEVNLDLPYCLNRGRFERVPEMFAELAKRDIKGITVDHLMSTQPLASLLQPAPNETSP